MEETESVARKLSLRSVHDGADGDRDRCADVVVVVTGGSGDGQDKAPTCCPFL